MKLDLFAEIPFVRFSINYRTNGDSAFFWIIKTLGEKVTKTIELGHFYIEIEQKSQQRYKDKSNIVYAYIKNELRIFFWYSFGNIQKFLLQ